MILVNQLSFTYPGNLDPTVKSIGFSIDEGEIFGFLGPSGAGKSTTQKILIRLLTGYQGEIEVMGKPLFKWGSDFYEHVGVGFELPNHYPRLTARENLSFFGSFYRQPVMKPQHLLEMVGMLEDADKKVESFSKGMKMRLNFVRALMHNPKILFFDEPTAGLDPVNARIMKNIILDLKQQGKTIFITTHNMHDADELCDRVAFLHQGEIKLVGSPHELKLRNGKRKLNIEYSNGTTQNEEFELEGIGHNEAFLDIIRNHYIRSVHTEEATLEDIFIAVTGARLS